MDLDTNRALEACQACSRLQEPWLNPHSSPLAPFPGTESISTNPAWRQRAAKQGLGPRWPNSTHALSREGWCPEKGAEGLHSGPMGMTSQTTRSWTKDTT